MLAKFYGDSESKMNISSREEMDRVMAEISKEKFKVIEVKKGERVKKAPLPFTTSTLQQEASKALNFPISKTMRIAQQLYEGVDVKGAGNGRSYHLPAYRLCPHFRGSRCTGT